MPFRNGSFSILPQQFTVCVTQKLLKWSVILKQIFWEFMITLAIKHNNKDNNVKTLQIFVTTCKYPESPNPCSPARSGKKSWHKALMVTAKIKGTGSCQSVTCTLPCPCSFLCGQKYEKQSQTWVEPDLKPHATLFLTTHKNIWSEKPILQHKLQHLLDTVHALHSCSAWKTLPMTPDAIQ